MEPKQLAMDHIRIGVVGYCPPTKFDAGEARRLIIKAYDAVTKQHPVAPIAIVSGLTNVGVLAIAYEEARARGWRTVGIACERAMEHSLFPVDEKLIIGEEWGEESPYFTAILHGMVRIGAGKQSVRETEVVKSRGYPTWEYDLPILQ